jgi:hypothetical protein
MEVRGRFIVGVRLGSGSDARREAERRLALRRRWMATATSFSLIASRSYRIEVNITIEEPSVLKQQEETIVSKGWQTN